MVKKKSLFGCRAPIEEDIIEIDFYEDKLKHNFRYWFVTIGKEFSPIIMNIQQLILLVE